MGIDANQFVETHLDSFKLRMRISHDAEDDNLVMMLSASVRAIAKLTGSHQVSDEFVELVMERARYVYHDALDEFRTNYDDEIHDLYLANLISAEGGTSDDAETDH